MSGTWKRTEVLAWTERDGPGRPPPGPGRALPVALAGTLAAVFAAIVSTDTLCPEHRAWVMGLATAAFGGSVVAMVGLLRGWALAPFLTMGVSAAGVVCGLIDAVHSATRGRLVAAGFTAVCLGATVLALRSVALRRWDRSLAHSLRPVFPVEATARTATEQAGEPVPDGSPAPAPGAAPPAGADRSLAER